VTQLRLAAASYVLAARTPFVYYGEEIGMANAAGLGGDPALRTPMSWTGDPLTAGFSTVPPFRELSANSQTNNVAAQTADGDSLLNYYGQLMGLRNSHPIIGQGDLDVQSDGGDPVLLLTRSLPNEAAIIAINYSAQSRSVTAMTSFAGATFDAVFGGSGAAASDPSGSLAIEVPGHSAVVYLHRP
jgi:glycosidase